MEERSVKVENIYKYFDTEIRKSMILSAFMKLIEADLESSVRTEAIAHLQSEEK
ncbi:MAG: hypothetical protein ACI4LP_08925 [Anaerovoracaceae bacterium]